MTDQPQQEQPGADWACIFRSDDANLTTYFHPGLCLMVNRIGVWRPGSADETVDSFAASMTTEARCRQISAAALAWERMKLAEQNCPQCGWNPPHHHLQCPQHQKNWQ